MSYAGSLLAAGMLFPEMQIRIELYHVFQNVGLFLWIARNGASVMSVVQ